MKKTLMYLVIVALIVFAAFFAYKKIYSEKLIMPPPEPGMGTAIHQEAGMFE